MKHTKKEIVADDTWVTYEHRATKKLKVDTFYTVDIVVEKGEVLTCTSTPDKLSKYEYGFDGGRASAPYPANFVKIFKVTERNVKEVVTAKETNKISKNRKKIENVRTTIETVEREEEELT